MLAFQLNPVATALGTCVCDWGSKSNTMTTVEHSQYNQDACFAVKSRYKKLQYVPYNTLHCMLLSRHRDIKHCFLVLSRDFFQYGSCAGSFYQEQKMANIGEFKIVSSEIP